jgi:hypothetical protein
MERQFGTLSGYVYAERVIPLRVGMTQTLEIKESLMAMCNWCGDEDKSTAWTSHVCIEEHETSTN